MLSGELKVRAERLQREQKKRAEEVQRRQQRERVVQERLQAQRAAHEEGLRQRRLAEEAAAEAERLKHEELVEANNGVWWSARLRAVPLAEDAARQKGIKRGADKVLLPASVGAELMRQEASRNGAQLFELASTSGRSMHAGVLDFNATEGMVAVPPLVARNLFGDGAGTPPDGATVTVTYRRLPKGLYARFQPRSADFQKLVGEHVEPVLEAALAAHSTLSEGSWIKVPFGDSSYELLVQKLRPGRAVSVIDTELEAEVEPSLETEQRLAAEAAAAAQAEREREAFLAQRAQQALVEAAEAERAAQGEAAAAAAKAADLERLRQDKAAALPPEPTVEEGATTACLIRLPDGTRLSRRFHASDPLRLLFDFVDAKGAAGGEPGSYRLVSQFPRRVLEAREAAEGNATLLDAGLTGQQEALLLERVSS